MGCFMSKRYHDNTEAELHTIVYELRNEIARLKTISNKISYDNILLKEKLSFQEIDKIRMSI